MAHGFEKLEQLFTVSRRKRRGGKKAAQQKKTPISTSRRPPSPIFPSPPYLRPTSTHMTPRDAQIDGPNRGKGCAQSVPSLQDELHKRSSTASSVTIVSRPSQSNASSSLRHRSKHLHTTSRPPRFRFPEDSLFKNDQQVRGSRNLYEKRMSREKMPLPCAAAPQGLLDWTPKHISLLFNPLDFKASSGDFTTETTGESARPKLLPSPCFVQSTPLLASHEPIVRPKQPTASQTSALLHKKLPPSPIQESPSPCIRPPTDPSPSSDSDDDHSNLMIHRSISLADITSSSPDTALTTPTATPTVDAYNKFKGRQTVRETWGSRLDDPRLGRNNEDIVPLNLRRPVSTSTLSTLTPSTSKDSVLKEPTFDDFYALSDDDIAESPLSTPGSCAPPTPPPKNTPDYHRKNSLPRVITSAHITFTPGQQEITPPDTPIDCDLLALTYSPTSPRNPFGALWAAELAKKYDFAVVYVMSLWPVGGGRSSNTLDNTLASEPRPNNMVAMGMAGASGNGSRISGRLLAAYGLNEVPSPFEIITETHLSALSCDYWNEYRNVDACPNDIARGWIRPFYSDYIPLSASSDATRNPRTCHPKNRGIIFAAYSKQTNNPIIPMRTSPEQDFRLGQLYLDAKTFVEALITQPYGLNKAPVFYPGLRNVNANIK